MGRMPLLGVGPPSIVYDSDAQAFFVATGLISTAQKNAVNDLVLSLKSGSIWTKFLAIYPIIGGTASAHSYNLKAPAQYQITWVGGPTHTATGVDFDGATQYGRTGIVPSTDQTIQNISLHYYSRENVAAATTIEIGSMISTTQRVQILLRVAGDLFLSDQYNTTGGRLSVANANSSGLFSASRTSAASHSAFRNGASIGSNATSGGTLPTVEYYLGAQNNAGVAANFSSKECAFAAIGQGLTDAELANLYTVVNTYQTALGRNV